ncbi:MAG: hypothetical protein IJ801_02760 [Lachnospiraceae bacterium]|nr:hypothetical protein [Lachnospiraceae bacterium]
MEILSAATNGTMYANRTNREKTAAFSNKGEKPVWNGKQAYKYLEDMNQAGLDYGARAVNYYAGKTAEDGELSVDELKKQIGEWFPDYTLTDREPGNVVQGKHYLYIDNSQLQKMAKDASYRAKVYGLMDRELTVGKEYTLTYSDGSNQTMHITGSVFSLCEANRKYAGADGVPYRGSCTSDHPWSSSNSHPQVRSMSFLSDHLDPAKSAGKSRISVVKRQAERLAGKRAEKKQAEKLAKKRTEQKQAEKLAKKRTEQKQMEKKVQVQNANEKMRSTWKERKATGAEKENVTLEISTEGMEQLERMVGSREEENPNQDVGVERQEQQDKTEQSEEQKGKVAVNEGKRLRQIAAAKTQAQIRAVMALLQGDLKDCEDGLENGECDQSEVDKVHALIAAAQKRMVEVSNKEATPEEEMAFSMAGLL